MKPNVRIVNAAPLIFLTKIEGLALLQISAETVSAPIDVVRIQDTHLSGGTDQEILEWAFQERLILLTHDVNTMTKYAFERTHAG